jgi:DNA-binding IclR family transcriptional regulator
MPRLRAQRRPTILSPDDRTLSRAIGLMLAAAENVEREHLTVQDLAELLNRPQTIIARMLIIMRQAGELDNAGVGLA